MGAQEKSEAKRDGQSRSAKNAAASQSKVVLVYVTGSLIPQRVVISGQQVNSASPLYMVRNDELRRTGGRDVASMLALDPSITFGRRR